MSDKPKFGSSLGDGWSLLRILLAGSLCLVIMAWDSRDGVQDLPFLATSFLAFVLVFGGYGLFWYLRYRFRGRE